MRDLLSSDDGADCGDSSVRRLTDRRPRRPTATSNFGAGRRESHDAGAFYARFHAPDISSDDTVRRPRFVDRLWCHDAADMDPFVEDASVALVVTSPPYFAGKAYEEALGHGHIPADYQAYRAMLYDVFEQCRAKLEPGGRIAVNVANLGRKPFRSLASDVIDILEQLGFLLRGEIVWRKGQAASGSCAWGTYQRPGNPVLRDLTERIVVASKGRFDRARSAQQRLAEGRPHEGSMARDDFVDATTDVWDIAPESATRVGHPAPFPVELPLRLIELFTYRGDLVLDPFLGSGTTAVAAIRSERHYAGFDIDPAYIELAERRIAAELAPVANDPTRRARVVVPARAPRRRNADLDAAPSLREAIESGHSIADVTRQLLIEAGLVDVRSTVRFPDLGLELAWSARDREGRTWLFDVCGGFSVTRPGLRNTATAWRAVGKAAVLDAARRTAPERTELGPLVLLSTDLPPARSPTGRAITGVTGAGRPISAVIELADIDAALDRLRHI